MPRKIYIFGDSWGAGVWENHKIIHKGLEFFLSNLGYIVINLSRPASSNLNLVRLLSKEIVNIDRNDFVFFITTDATRDRFFTTNSLTKCLQENQSLSGLVDILLDSTYNMLNDLCQQFNSKIYMIGALNNLDSSILNYNNLIPIVSSWVNLLVGHLNEYSNTIDNKFRILSNPNCRIELVNLKLLTDLQAKNVIEDFYLYQETNSMVFKESVFHPDGVHPNHNGHEILFHHIRAKLNL